MAAKRRMHQFDFAINQALSNHFHQQQKLIFSFSKLRIAMHYCMLYVLSFLSKFEEKKSQPLSKKSSVNIFLIFIPEIFFQHLVRVTSCLSVGGKTAPELSHIFQRVKHVGFFTISKYRIEVKHSFCYLNV